MEVLWLSWCMWIVRQDKAEKTDFMVKITLKTYGLNLVNQGSGIFCLSSWLAGVWTVCSYFKPKGQSLATCPSSVNEWGLGMHIAAQVCLLKVLGPKEMNIQLCSL